MTQKSHYNRDCQWAGTSTGKKRSQFTVDVLTLDGQVMKDQLNQTERLKIFAKMGFSSTNYNGESEGFAGHPIYTFRLKEEVDISTIPSSRIEISRMKRHIDGTKTKQIVGCKVRDIDEDASNFSTKNSTYDPNIKWVKFEKTLYKFKEEHVKNWLDVYGELLTNVQEETEEMFIPEPESDESDDDCSVLDEDFLAGLPATKGTGTYKAKMKLKSRPPQYLPVYGQKVRVHYQGIEKMCTHCYRGGHLKKNCKNEKVPWINYVKTFMDKNTQIPSEMYGRWWKVVKNEFTHQPVVEEQYQNPRLHIPIRDLQIEEVNQLLQGIRETEKQSRAEKNDVHPTEEHLVDETRDEKDEKMEDQNQDENQDQNESERQDFILMKAATTGTVPKKRLGRPPGKPKPK